MSDFVDASNDPKSFVDKMHEHSNPPGQLRELWFASDSKKMHKQLKPAEIRALWLVACFLLGLPSVHNMGEGVHVPL